MGMRGLAVVLLQVNPEEDTAMNQMVTCGHCYT